MNLACLDVSSIEHCMYGNNNNLENGFVCSKCEPPYSLSLNRKTCMECVLNCKVCESDIACHECYAGYVLDDSKAQCLECPAKCRFSCKMAGAEPECDCEPNDDYVNVDDGDVSAGCATLECLTYLEDKSHYFGPTFKGYYDCIWCKPGCEQCVWDAATELEKCIKCDGDTDDQIDENGKLCQAADPCPDQMTKFVISEEESYCIDCPPGCQTCFINDDGLFQCNECMEGFDPYESQCQMMDFFPCLNHEYLRFVPGDDSEEHLCDDCPQGCVTCQFNYHSKTMPTCS